MKLLTLLLIFFTVLVCQESLAQQREHTVARGETLASIAQKYGLTEAQLKAANPNMTMCFTGVRLVIPDPNAPAAVEEASDEPSDKTKGEKDKDDPEKSSGVNKFLKSAGKTLGKAAKVTGSVASAVVVTKLKGGSYYDAINNAIDAADSTLHDKKSDYGIGSLLTKDDPKKKAGDKVDDLVDAAKDDAKSAHAAADGVQGLVDAVDPELVAQYEAYKTKYDQFVGELEKVKDVYMKANSTAKMRTWQTVSDAVKEYKTQLAKIRTECEQYSGHIITPAAVESWAPIKPKR